MFKIKWKEMGARLTRIFASEKEMETAVAGLRQAGISAAQVIAPATVTRLKPKSKPRVKGGRGTHIVGADGRTIQVGEKCFYHPSRFEQAWKRGTLEKVKSASPYSSAPDAVYAWVRGKYLPWKMVAASEIRALPLNTAKVDAALKLYPNRREHHEAGAEFRRTRVPA